MNATLFENIPINRTALVPDSTDEVSGSWCRQVAEQQIRGFGFSGSSIVTIPATKDYSAAVHNIKLPINAFGTQPPMIWAYPQYGSVVYYRQFEDVNRHMGAPIPPPPLTAGVSPIFRTWIDNLTRVADGVSGGTYWQFDIRHRLRVSRLPIEPNLGAGYFSNSFPLFEKVYWNHYPAHTKMILHWYAIGADNQEA